MIDVVDATPSLIAEFARATSQQARVLQTDRVLLVGIARGGVVLADAVENEFQHAGKNFKRSDVVCQRPATEQKSSKSFLGLLIRRGISASPKHVTNWLRRIEHQVLMNMRSPVRQVTVVDSSRAEQVECIVIVDDAVDSGYSLKAVIEHFGKLYPGVDVFSSTFTTTQRNSVIVPDYSFFRYKLVRFPWSLDG